MITIEKNLNDDEVAIHATPEDLREFAKMLWAISEKADLKGKHKEQLTTKKTDDVWLSTKRQGDARHYGIIKKLLIHSRSQ